jgi:hypothetical protein
MASICRQRGLCPGHHITRHTDMHACYLAGMERPRLPIAAHADRSWRIHEIAPDFRVEDVWALPTPGGPGDFPRLVAQLVAGLGKPSGASRALFAVRERLGALVGWDRPGTGVGARVRSLRDRLPADLRDGPRGPDLPRPPFRSVYLTDTEWAAEIANGTVHAVMHIGWVRSMAGRWPCSSSRTDGLAGPTWPLSRRSATWSCIRRWCARSAGPGGCARRARLPAERPRRFGRFGWITFRGFASRRRVSRSAARYRGR